MRMTERERRNQVPDEDLYSESELLVYGHFHEDESDNGFKATRWVPWTEVELVVSEEGPEEWRSAAEAFGMLEEFIEGARSMLVPAH